MALEVRTAYYRLEHAFESIPLHRVQTEAAGEALKLARARYREQLATMVELNEAAAQLARISHQKVAKSRPLWHKRS